MILETNDAVPVILGILRGTEDALLAAPAVHFLEQMGRTRPSAVASHLSKAHAPQLLLRCLSRWQDSLEIVSGLLNLFAFALQSSCRNMAEHAEYTERTQKDESLRDAYRSSSSRVPQALLHIAHGDIDTIENSERRKAWIVVRKTAAGLAREWKGISELLTTG